MCQHKRDLQAVLILEGGNLLDSSPVTHHRKQKEHLVVYIEAHRSTEGSYLCAFSVMLEKVEE